MPWTTRGEQPCDPLRPRQTMDTTNHVTIAVDSSESCNKLLHNSSMGGEENNVHHHGSLFQICVNVNSGPVTHKKKWQPTYYMPVCIFVTIIYSAQNCCQQKKKKNATLFIVDNWSKHNPHRCWLLQTRKQKLIITFSNPDYISSICGQVLGLELS